MNGFDCRFEIPVIDHCRYLFCVQGIDLVHNGVIVFCCNGFADFVFNLINGGLQIERLIGCLDAKGIIFGIFDGFGRIVCQYDDIQIGIVVNRFFCHGFDRFIGDDHIIVSDRQQDAQDYADDLADQRKLLVAFQLGKEDRTPKDHQNYDHWDHKLERKDVQDE